jgi:hypothetical protein
VIRRALCALLLLLVAAHCRKPAPVSTNLKVENKVALRTVRLYFESQDMLLSAEKRDVELPENPAGAMALVVRELLKGSANASIARLFPADTVVRGTYLLPDGLVLVDLGGPTLTQGWGTGSHQEMMAVYSVVQTLTTNFAEAKRVRFLLNGEPAETLAGHIAMDKPLSPMPALLGGRAG